MAMNKGKQYREHITSPRWRRLRKTKLTQQPLCEVCESKNIYRLATEVHHKTPVESVALSRDQELLMFNIDNLMSVCHECHVALHKSIGKNTKEETKQRKEDEVDAAIAHLFGD